MAKITQLICITVMCRYIICVVLARVVRKVDNALHRINHYPVDSVVCFVNTYQLDSDLSGG